MTSRSTRTISHLTAKDEPAEVRRRVQNRNAQRNYRKRVNQRLDELASIRQVLASNSDPESLTEITNESASPPPTAYNSNGPHPSPFGSAPLSPHFGRNASHSQTHGTSFRQVEPTSAGGEPTSAGGEPASAGGGDSASSLPEMAGVWDEPGVFEALGHIGPTDPLNGSPAHFGDDQSLNRSLTCPNFTELAAIPSPAPLPLTTQTNSSYSGAPSATSPPTLRGLPKTRRTPLHEAAQRNNAEILRLLINGGANVYSCDSEGNKPLHLAASAGAVSSARVLLDLGCNVDCRDQYGRTPLYWAVTADQQQMVEFLLMRGANVNSEG